MIKMVIKWILIVNEICTVQLYLYLFLIQSRYVEKNVFNSKDLDKKKLSINL